MFLRIIYRIVSQNNFNADLFYRKARLNLIDAGLLLVLCQQGIKRKGI